MAKFLLRLSLLTIATMAAYHYAAAVIPPKWYFPDFWWLPVFIAIVTAILHSGLLQRRDNSKAFIRFYMGSTGIRLFIYLTTIIVVAMLNKAMALPFALCFFFFYICFTAFEVGGAMKYFGGNSSAGSEKK